MNAFLNGLMIVSGLIAAIGAQNAFVLKQGLMKQHILLVVSLCWLCDILLIGSGIFAVSALASNHPKLSSLLSLSGGIFLLYYGISNLRSAYQGGHSLNPETAGVTTSALKTAAATLAVTLLNPHVYIDTVMLIGGSAAGLNLSHKIQFFLGAITASFIWFFSIGFGARLLLPLFRRELTWQILDLLIALMMFYLSYGLFKTAFLSW